jgi:hypothetical protein
LATPYLQDCDLVLSALIVPWLAQDQGSLPNADRRQFLASASQF